jgi:hypothetical protein
VWYPVVVVIANCSFREAAPDGEYRGDRRKSLNERRKIGNVDCRLARVRSQIFFSQVSWKTGAIEEMTWGLAAGPILRADVIVRLTNGMFIRLQPRTVIRAQLSQGNPVGTRKSLLRFVDAGWIFTKKLVRPSVTDVSETAAV